MPPKDVNRSAGSVLDALLSKRGKLLAMQLGQHPHHGAKRLLLSKPPAKLVQAAVEASGTRKVSNVNPLFISMVKPLKLHKQKKDSKTDSRDSPTKQRGGKEADEKKTMPGTAPTPDEASSNSTRKKRSRFFSSSDAPPTSRARQDTEASPSLAALKHRLRHGKGGETRAASSEPGLQPKRFKTEHTSGAVSSSTRSPHSMEQRKGDAAAAKGEATPKEAHRWVRHCTSRRTKTMHCGTTKAASLFRFWRWSISATKGKSRLGASSARSNSISDLQRGTPLRMIKAYWKRLAITPWRRKNSRTAWLRHALRTLNSTHWLLVRRVVAVRRGFVQRLSHSFLLSSTTAAAKAMLDPCRPVLGPRLALARLFPLFGVAVRVLWIGWGDAVEGSAREAHKAPTRGITDCGLGRLTIAACEKGIVLHESKSRLGVALLPRQARLVRELVGGSNTLRAAGAAAESSSLTHEPAGTIPTIAQYIAPRVIQVRKVFPGSSGSETDLIQKLLSSTVCRLQGQDAPRRNKVVVTMVAGEVGAALPESTEPNLLDCLKNRFLNPFFVFLCGREAHPLVAQMSKYGIKRSRSPSSSRCDSRSSTASESAAVRKVENHKDSGRDVAVFIFRRDLRLFDNTAMLRLVERVCNTSLRILPLFFFNPQQADAEKNPYFGHASFQFMLESLEDLDGPQQLDGKLVCLRGSDSECLMNVQQHGFRIRFIGFNKDFTPFALARDAHLMEWCQAHQVVCVESNDDYTLLPLDAVLKQNGEPYSVFTPFYRCVMSDFACKVPKPHVRALDITQLFVKDGKMLLDSVAVNLRQLLKDFRQALSDKGGRSEGLRRLDSVSAMQNYDADRDMIARDATSHLSPHLKFGTVSVREVWDASVRVLGQTHGFTRQLVWREFYAMLLHHHPRLVGGQLRVFPALAGGCCGNQPFLAKYLDYRWVWQEAHYDAFKRGRTGVPLVDAAVRCLNETGWCHNRCRMVIANFLVKVLSVDWREGERWFATKAVDYDVANNSGGWLWSSGQGADAQPYFRTFNPFRQSERFDPTAGFIQTWVPELRGLPPALIHTWDEYCRKQQHKPRGEPSDGAKPEGLVGDETNGTTNPPLTSKGKGKSGVRYVTAYPAPIVEIKTCTQAVIQEFKKYDAQK